MTTYATEDFGFLRLSGPDAAKFLQGYTTCDLAPVLAGSASIGAICNLKGRMVTSFRVAAHGDDLLLRMHRDLVPETITFLSKYIVFSKAEMTDASDAWHVVGTDSDTRDGTEDAPAPTAITAVTPIDNGLAVDVDGARVELWTTGEPHVDEPAGAWARLDVESGLAWISPATVGEYLPQMFAYDALGAIDFEKGCYLGQEIVARAHFLGAVKRQLHRATSPSALPVGTTLTDGTRDVGQVVGAAPARGSSASELLVVAPSGTVGRLDAPGPSGNVPVTISWSIPKA